MRKAFLIGFLLILSSFSSTAVLDSKISNSCGTGYVPVISMADKNESYNNPGPPNMYSDKLCVSGIENSFIANDCIDKGVTAFYLFSETTESHFSIFESYNKHVCTGDMEVRIESECGSGQEPLFSVSSEHNAHVAKPGFYNLTACGFLQPPKNVTLEIKGNLSSNDEVHFDGEKVEGEQTYYPPADKPYLVSKSGDIVRGIISRNFIRAERKIEDENVLSVSRNKDRAEYLLAFTEASIEDVETSQEDFQNRELLTSLQPSIGFFTPNIPRIRVSLDPEEAIQSDIGLSPGGYQLNITKIGENRVRITAE